MKRFVVALACAGWLAFGSAAEIATIRHGDAGFSGQDELRFAPATTLRLPPSLPWRIVLDRYVGEWEAGVASGFGRLEGRYVVPSTDNPVYRQLQSSDPASRGQALAVIERVRAEAVFFKRDPDEAERQLLGERSFPVAYRGEFRKGQAQGVGELSSPARKLKASFHQWLPEGRVTHLFGELPVLSETFAGGLPADGPVVLHRYPAGIAAPAHTFVGELRGGQLTGDWFQLPWGGSSETHDILGLGDTTRVATRDGSSLVCNYDAGWMRRPAATDLSVARGAVDVLDISDPTYLKLPVACRLLAPNGWSFQFRLAGSGPFDTRHAPPYACADPQGRVGTMSIGTDDIPKCNVTYTVTEYRWGSKLGRAVEKGLRDVRDAVFTPLDSLGKSMTETMCGMVGKEPGKNCNVNFAVGTTVEIADSKSEQEQRARDELARFLAAREKLARDPGPPGLRGQWEAAAALRTACAQSCTGPARAYSMLSVEEIQRTLTAGFDEDVKRTRLASIAGDAWAFASRWLPLAETGAATYSGGKVIARLDAAQLYVDALKPGPGVTNLQLLGLQTSLNTLHDKFVPGVLLGLTAEWANLVPTMVFSEIPGLSNDQQLALAIGFGIGRPQDFFRKYHEFRTQDELVQQLIEEKFRQWKVPPPRTP